jgi:ABC-type nitrate/sulfonate/bicarbonate transport system permease component
VFAAFVTLAIWELIAAYVGSPLLIPSPGAVAARASRLIANGELVAHVGVSLERLGVGLLVGVPVGVLLGCAMGRSGFLDGLFDPFLRMANSTPAIALIPFTLLWFGVMEVGRYALLVYIIAVTVTLNARHGVRQVPSIRLKAASSLGLTRTDTFIRVIIPSSIPATLVGIRTALGLGVMVIVAAEMFGVPRI